MTTIRYTAPWLIVLLALGLCRHASAQPPVSGATTTDWSNGTVPGSAATNNWNTGSNWSGGVPDVNNQDFAVINNGGYAYVDSNVAQTPGGVSLGTNASESGTLDILSGGSLTVVEANLFAEDGSVRIGQAGTGTLYVRPGGTLNSVSLLLGAASTANSLNLGGTAAGTTTVNTGNVTLNRTTRITGPNVKLSATGPLSMSGNSNLIAEITATTHSALKTTAAATLGGTLRLDFTDYTPSASDTWNLVDAASIFGNFSQIVPDPGFALGLGQSYAVRTVDGGNNGRLAQLYVNQQLVLNVNRNTGVVSISNPGSTGISFDGYAIRSAVGNLNASDASWNSLEEQPGLTGGGWVEAQANANQISELKSSGISTVPAGATWELGNVFNPITPTEFGQNTSDLQFIYTDPVTGNTGNLTPNYNGSAGVNNLVLFADPATGNVKIRNTSPFTVSIDGYTIASPSGSLNSTDALWTSLSESVGNTWSEGSLSDTRVSELQSTGSTSLLLNGGTTFDLGGLLKLGGLKDLLFQFALEGSGAATTGVVVYEEAPTVVGVFGDYNNDGTVNAADYTVWRDNLGGTGLQNEGGISPGVVDAADYNFWKSRFGATSNPGSGGGSLTGTAVPEPASLWMLAVAGIAACGTRRRKRWEQQRASI